MKAAFVFAASIVLGACGNNNPEVPPEYLAPVQTSGDYPSGPYGTDEGDTIANLSFTQGWTDPQASGCDTSKLGPMKFGDFYDPEGKKGLRLILINTAAVWCGACKAEHQGGKSPSLSEHYTSLKPKGLSIISLLFQNSKSEPAASVDLNAWCQSYDTNFPFALDPEYQMGIFASAETAPLNLIVDARTMKIKKKFIGDQAAVIWPYIESELSAQ